MEGAILEKVGKRQVAIEFENINQIVICDETDLLVRWLMDR